MFFIQQSVLITMVVSTSDDVNKMGVWKAKVIRISDRYCIKREDYLVGIEAFHQKQSFQECEDH